MAKRRSTKTKHYGGRAHIMEVMGLPVDTPLIDATEDITFAVRKGDVSRATPKDPTSCGYAKALCRETGRTNIRVYRNSTLIQQEDEKGNPIVVRYRTSPYMKLILSKFDLNGRMHEHEITLKAPKSSQTLDYQREVRENFRARVREGYVPQGHSRIGDDEASIKALGMLRPRLMSNEAF